MADMGRNMGEDRMRLLRSLRGSPVRRTLAIEVGDMDFERSPRPGPLTRSLASSGD